MLGKEEFEEIELRVWDGVYRDSYNGRAIASMDITEQEAKLVHMQRALEWACSRWQEESEKCPKQWPLDRCPSEIGDDCKLEKVGCAMMEAINATKEAEND